MLFVLKKFNTFYVLETSPRKQQVLIFVTSDLALGSFAWRKKRLYWSGKSSGGLYSASSLIGQLRTTSVSVRSRWKEMRGDSLDIWTKGNVFCPFGCWPCVIKALVLCLLQFHLALIAWSLVDLVYQDTKYLLTLEILKEIHSCLLFWRQVNRY